MGKELERSGASLSLLVLKSSQNVATDYRDSGALGQKEVPLPVEAWKRDSGSDGRRSRDLSIFSRTLYQLSYRALYGRSYIEGTTAWREAIVPCDPDRT